MSEQRWVEPPPGWFTLGTHADQDVRLEFSIYAVDEDGLPLWERPVSVGQEDQVGEPQKPPRLAGSGASDRPDLNIKRPAERPAAGESIPPGPASVREDGTP